MVARNKLVINGTIGSTEVWSCSLHFAGAGGEVVGGSANLSEWCQDAFDFLNGGGISSLILNLMSTNVDITSMRAYQYDASGPAVAVGEAIDVVEGLGTGGCPNQTCLVVSLRADQIGARYRGRMYWPAVGAEITAGLISGLAPTVNIADTFSEMITGLGAAAGIVGDLLPMVYSPTYDLLTPVSSVLVDSVPDVQRRRADNLVGTIYQRAVPYVA